MQECIASVQEDNELKGVICSGGGAKVRSNNSNEQSGTNDARSSSSSSSEDNSCSELKNKSILPSLPDQAGLNLSILVPTDLLETCNEDENSNRSSYH